MLAKSCSLFIYYQKGPVGGPGTLLTEGVYSSEVGITCLIRLIVVFRGATARVLLTDELGPPDPN